ncbi:carboxypeptidase M32 [Halioglobus japonicus]|uniref:Metal-dependent carboxypeptidase n=1 Tax=Halioglobus japonicus TaxID=930805 RepID=A0AAP8MDX0_9GAMM|nr:carboxypeptidase M32 [Halioglobus japonicus]AQA17792.1 carboxypeptidase M32 [Halioglobus japonicus]PLW85747.1 carboxypeptidase M32 [Halioglobus japonicus]GHD17303.1 carboxypeptidase M32 [Halioglobus japonicus]
MNAYQKLEATHKRLSALRNAEGILFWDHETMMPSGAAEARAEVEAELSVMQHEIQTDPATADAIAEAEQQREQLDPWQQANLREIKRLYRHANAVPADLVEKMVHARHEATMVWREARPANDFKRLAPKLKALFDLKREEAGIKAELFGITPYEALLDQYDPGRREVQIDAIFDDLAGFLPNFLQQVLEKQAQGPAILQPQGPFALDKQEALSRAVMEVLDFPFDRGRLDVAAHPFSGGADGDNRITTRYEESDFTASLMAVVHEVGHALYEDGRPKDWLSQPVGNSRDMTLHESQSLLLEMQAGRSEAFIRHLAPIIRDTLGGSGPAWEADNLVRLQHKVAPGLIRVYADEVTYPLHVILRYKLEKAIVADDITIDDLPGAWNEMMQRYLGITPPSDTDGVMQDVHWPEGLFGYFPTYSLGAMAAAQIFAAANRAVPEIMPGLAEGNLKPLYGWLDTHIRSQGCLYLPDELIERATGEPLGTAAYKAAVTARYLNN